SFAGDQPLDCKDYVLGKLGMKWEPKSPRDNQMEQMRKAAYAAPKTGNAEYIYRQADGTPYLRVKRPGFYQSHWNGISWENDEPGAAHAHKVARELTGIARNVHIVNLPGVQAKGDVTDWMEAGGDTDQLVELLRSAEPVDADQLNATEPPLAQDNILNAAIPLTFFNEMGEAANKRWIVKGIIAKGETSSWISPPGKG